MQSTLKLGGVGAYPQKILQTAYSEIDFGGNL